jgi:hypothetical protein
VHHGLWLPAFAVRSIARLRWTNQETSRFPSERRARMPGSIDDAEPSGACDYAPKRIAFCRLEGIGTPIGKSYAAQWLAYAYPCQRFARGLATARA